MQKRTRVFLNLRIALVASFVIILFFVASAYKTESYNFIVGTSGFAILAYLIAGLVQILFDKIGLTGKILPFFSISILGSAFVMILAHTFGTITAVDDSRRLPEKIFQSVAITVFLSIITIPFTAFYYYMPNLLQIVKAKLAK